jgi:hypothetical protein
LVLESVEDGGGPDEVDVLFEGRDEVVEGLLAVVKGKVVDVVEEFCVFFLGDEAHAD